MGTVQPHPENLADVALLVDGATEVLALLWGRMADDVPQRVSLPQLRALMIIARNQGIKLTALGEAMDALPSSASRLCDRLVAAGLIEREVNAADRREVRLSLTGEGGRLLEHLARARRRYLGEVIAQMPPAARQALVQGLTEFTRAAARTDDVQLREAAAGQ
ncbi:MAG: MarR family transcriptional regulator [Kineosporiaceae bacterium]